jgi:hypothetical protein
MIEHLRNYRCESCVNLDVRCEECRQRRAQKQRADRAGRVARGLCRSCTSPAMPGLQLCAEHLGLITAPLPETVADLHAERRLHLAEKLTIDSQIASIRSQLDEFDAQGASDAAARARALAALLHRRRRSQILQHRIGELGRAAHRLEQATDERRFVQAARTVLDRETYLRIWAIVNDAKGG